ncbi:hypothetical protein [Streptomyces sp. NPDC050485]|jgi:hypothetical protein
MTFVADDAALAMGDGGWFTGDGIGCEPQLGKPEAESAAGRR